MDSPVKQEWKWRQLEATEELLFTITQLLQVSLKWSLSSGANICQVIGFSYCTLKPSILLKIVLEITWSKSCFSWSGFDTNSILKNGLTIAVLEMEETSITKEEGRLSTGEPVISISRYAKEVIYSSFREAEGQRRHRPWLWNCNTSGVMSTT